MVRYKVQNVMLKLVSVKKNLFFSDLDFYYSTKFAIWENKSELWVAITFFIIIHWWKHSHILKYMSIYGKM